MRQLEEENMTTGSGARLVIARGGVISKEEALGSLLQLKRIGWFSPGVRVSHKYYR